jgi:signal transduction histidine kinase
VTTRTKSFAERLPPWMGSIRVRLTVLYSVVLFGLAALVVLGIYAGVSRTLNSQQVSESDSFDAVIVLSDGQVIGRNDREARAFVEQLESAVNRRALNKLRQYSFTALGLLFVGSLGVGYWVAGRVLRPIGRITNVARDIQATDLSRRIDMRGPNDEIQQLADTFDAMLARLDAAFESQRRFIHEASHELRNPLAVIRTNLEVVLSDPDSTAEDLREVGVVVSRTAERMSTLVDDLLLYARREAPASRAGLIDLALLVSEAAADFRATAETNGLRIDHVAMPGLWINADAIGIRQALANLLANAIRHAPSDTAVRLAAGSEGGWIWVAVEDHGPGIAPEDQARVWQRFWRGDRRRAREEGRSGLGLSIVRQIVARHHGRVQLVSELGKGSTFVLWFPAVEPPPPDTGPVPIVTGTSPLTSVSNS